MKEYSPTSCVSWSSSCLATHEVCDHERTDATVWIDTHSRATQIVVNSSMSHVPPPVPTVEKHKMRDDAQEELGRCARFEVIGNFESSKMSKMTFIETINESQNDYPSPSTRSKQQHPQAHPST
jgi:hypothetical protein